VAALVVRAVGCGAPRPNRIDIGTILLDGPTNRKPVIETGIEQALVGRNTGIYNPNGNACSGTVVPGRWDVVLVKRPGCFGIGRDGGIVGGT